MDIFIRSRKEGVKDPKSSIKKKPGYPTHSIVPAGCGTARKFKKLYHTKIIGNTDINVKAKSMANAGELSIREIFRPAVFDVGLNQKT